MTYNIGISTPISISALALTVLPDHEEFMSFDDSLLEQKQIFASQIDELKDLVNDFGIPDYPIIFCRIPYMRGCVYLEGDVSWPLMFIDSFSSNTVEILRETYIHEASHLLSDGQDHDFAFAVTHNTFRLKAGLASSDLDYDYRACDIAKTSLSDIKVLSKQFAQIILNSSMPMDKVIEEMRFTITFLAENKYKSPDDREVILETFTNYVTGLVG